MGGESPYAYRRIETTEEFMEVVKPLFERDREKKELAKVFQALRIEVNQEMDALKEMLTAAVELLRPGRSLSGVDLSFFEDRMVKNLVKTGNVEGKRIQDFYGNVDCPLRAVHNKVIVPGEEEQRANPRSRSAKVENRGKEIKDEGRTGFEEKTDVEPVGVPTEEAAEVPGRRRPCRAGDMSDEDGVMPGDEEKAESGELSPIKAFTESEGWTSVLTCLYARYWVGTSLRPGGCVVRWD